MTEAPKKVGNDLAYSLKPASLFPAARAASLCDLYCFFCGLFTFWEVLGRDTIR